MSIHARNEVHDVLFDAWNLLKVASPRTKKQTKNECCKLYLFGHYNRIIQAATELHQQITIKELIIYKTNNSQPLDAIYMTELTAQ